MKCLMNSQVKNVLVLVIFSAFTLHAMATDWKGTWNSTFGEISITTTATRDIVADMGDYLLWGNITGNATNRTGVFSGSYMLKPYLNKPLSQIQHHNILGSRGQFSITLNSTKQSFSGTYIASVNNREGSWSGSKVNVASTSTTTESPVRSFSTITPTKTEAVLWTGTWQTNKLGQLKIKWYSEDRIEAKLFFKRGDYIRAADLRGGKVAGMAGYNNKYAFVGPYKDSDGKEGQFFFLLDANDPQLNTLSGYIYIKDRSYKNNQLDHYSHHNINGITGTRTSSAEPNMSRYE